MNLSDGVVVAVPTFCTTSVETPTREAFFAKYGAYRVVAPLAIPSALYATGCATNESSWCVLTTTATGWSAVIVTA